MFYYNDFSHYRAENILHESSNPSHSGPELCTQMPKSIHADRLAREVVLDKISLSETVRPASSSAGTDRSLRMKF
jgi:hypothetical protein